MTRYEHKAAEDKQADWDRKIGKMEAGRRHANGNGHGQDSETREPPRDEAATKAERAAWADLDIADLMRAARLNKNDLSEADVADVFAERAKGRLIFVHGIGKWFEWTGAYWRQDERKRAFEAIKRLGQGISDELPAKEVKLRRSTRVSTPRLLLSPKDFWANCSKSSSSRRKAAPSHSRSPKPRTLRASRLTVR